MRWVRLLRPPRHELLPAGDREGENRSTRSAPRRARSRAERGRRARRAALRRRIARGMADDRCSAEAVASFRVAPEIAAAPVGSRARSSSPAPSWHCRGPPPTPAPGRSAPAAPPETARRSAAIRRSLRPPTTAAQRVGGAVVAPTANPVRTWAHAEARARHRRSSRATTPARARSSRSAREGARASPSSARPEGEVAIRLLKKIEQDADAARAPAPTPHATSRARSGRICSAPRFAFSLRGLFCESPGRPAQTRRAGRASEPRGIVEPTEPPGAASSPLSLRGLFAQVAGTTRAQTRRSRLLSRGA